MMNHRTYRDVYKPIWISWLLAYQPHPSPILVQQSPTEGRSAGRQGARVRFLPQRVGLRAQTLTPCKWTSFFWRIKPIKSPNSWKMKRIWNITLANLSSALASPFQIFRHGPNPWHRKSGVAHDPFPHVWQWIPYIWWLNLDIVVVF